MKNTTKNVADLVDGDVVYHVGQLKLVRSATERATGVTVEFEGVDGALARVRTERTNFKTGTELRFVGTVED